MTRHDVINVVRSLFRFGEVKSSKLDASKSVVVELAAGDDEESAKDDEIAGFGPLQFKPLAGQDALFMQLGDEKVCLAIKNRDWQISIGNGEVILQALGGTTPAYLHLKPNGDATLKGAALNLDMSAAATLKCTDFTVDMSGEAKLGQSSAPAYLHLKPNGDATLKCANFTVDMSEEAKIGNDPDELQFAALANLVDAELTAVSAVITTLCTALGVTVPWTYPGTAPSNTPPLRSVAASKTKVL